MLGELIYEAKGKVTGMRVIDVENGLPKVETTISNKGLVLDSPGNHNGAIEYSKYRVNTTICGYERINTRMNMQKSILYRTTYTVVNPVCCNVGRINL